MRDNFAIQLHLDCKLNARETLCTLEITVYYCLGELILLFACCVWTESPRGHRQEPGGAGPSTSAAAGSPRHQKP